MKKALKILKRRLQGIPPEKSAPQKYFSAVYKHNFWNGEHSRSGTGSEGSFATQKIELVKHIVSEYNISTILDLGCGDFFWMQEIASQLPRYHGIDVVPSVIEQNIAIHASDTVSFQCLDLSKKDDQSRLQLQSCDLILCFDVIGHMLNDEIDRFLEYVFYHLNGRYLLLTNRIDEKSERYLQRPKSRLEGINIQKHPLFLKHQLKPVWKKKAAYPGDFFELYDLNDLKN